MSRFACINSPYSLVLYAALLFASFINAARAVAQAVGGTISGTVKESSGAVLPEAVVVVTNTKTGVSTTVHTNHDGLYRASNLQPGTYDLMISISGFSSGENKNIVVTPGGENTIDFTLKVAVTNEQVTVTGTEAAVDLGSSTLSYDVPGTAVRELPLNGRDFTTLATLLPGVSQINAAPAGTARTGFGRALTISGQRPSENNYLEDGISLNDQANDTPGSVLGVTLGVDAIDQFTILTDTFPAEYGNASGGIFNAVTKSGTDQFHGNIFYFGRNSDIDARQRFDFSQTNHTPSPAFRRHQYGASIGGPIKKDKAFFFGNFEAHPGYRTSFGMSGKDAENARNAHLPSFMGEETGGRIWKFDSSDPHANSCSSPDSCGAVVSGPSAPPQ